MVGMTPTTFSVLTVLILMGCLAPNPAPVPSRSIEFNANLPGVYVRPAPKANAIPEVIWLTLVRPYEPCKECGR